MELEVVNDYVIVKIIGNGGAGIVYHVHKNNEQFALKMMSVENVSLNARREVIIFICINFA